MIKWARGVLADPDHHVILDTETTGLKLWDEVIQVAVINTAGTVLLDSFIRPVDRARIPTNASHIHGITMKTLKDAPTYPEIAPSLMNILKGRTVVCYNAEFDGRLLNQTAEKTGAPAFTGKWACAMRGYARFRGDWNPEKSDYRWHKLPEGDHSALGDCRATLEIIKEMAKDRPLRHWYEFWL
jgi:DNA polymerase-3 subunit epsilon